MCEHWPMECSEVSDCGGCVCMECTRGYTPEIPDWVELDQLTSLLLHKDGGIFTTTNTAMGVY